MRKITDERLKELEKYSNTFNLLCDQLSKKMNLFSQEVISRVFNQDTLNETYSIAQKISAFANLRKTDRYGNDLTPYEEKAFNAWETNSKKAICAYGNTLITIFRVLSGASALPHSYKPLLETAIKFFSLIPGYKSNDGDNADASLAEARRSLRQLSSSN